MVTCQFAGHVIAQIHINGVGRAVCQTLQDLSKIIYLYYIVIKKMSQEQAIINDFEDRTRESWASLADYDTVTALLLYWEEDDLNVKPEVIRLECLLSDDFGFSTSTVLIPSTSPKAELQYQLAAFVKEHSLTKKSLSIVYYAGHADNSNENAPAGYSEWRAYVMPLQPLTLGLQWLQDGARGTKRELVRDTTLTLCCGG
jgi:hypothetical protein